MYHKIYKFRSFSSAKHKSHHKEVYGNGYAIHRNGSQGAAYAEPKENVE